MNKAVKIVIGVLLIPIIYELAGIVVNQASTTMQTSKLRKEIAEVIPNTEIISAKSQTGNTTGT